VGAHMCTSLSQWSTRQAKYTYSTLLVFSLFGRVVYASATLHGDRLHTQPYTKPSMAPNNQQQQAAAAVVVRLPEFHADEPQAWFDCLNSTFATANITQSITKLGHV
jgi:hypothetical protein